MSSHNRVAGAFPARPLTPCLRDPMPPRPFCMVILGPHESARRDRIRDAHRLCDALQDDLAQNPCWWNPLIFLRVVSGGDGDYKLQRRDDEETLTAFALRPPHPLQPARCPAFGLAEGNVHDEPLISIAANFIGADYGCGAASHPFTG